MSNIRVSKEEYLDYLGVNSINVSRESIFDFIKSKKIKGEKGPYVEFDFKITDIDDIDYQDYADDFDRVDKLFDCVWGEDNKDGMLNQLMAYPDWYFDFHDNVNEKIKRWWLEVNETLDKIKNIDRNLNDPRTKCEPYKVYLKDVEHIFNIDLVFLKSKFQFLVSPSHFVDNDTLRSPDGKKMMAEIMKSVHVFIKKYNELASKIIKKSKDPIK